MSAPLLSLDRVEFPIVKIEAVTGAKTEVHQAFPQLKSEFDDLIVLVRSRLNYPEQEADDPVTFLFSYGIKIDAESQKSGAVPPYNIEIEALAFLKYVGKQNHVGVERFRAVRFSGYQILYGAMREMIANVTSRSSHGLWHLPARDFLGAAKARADDDEQGRQLLLAKRNGKVRAGGDTATQGRGVRKSSNPVEPQSGDDT